MASLEDETLGIDDSTGTNSLMEAALATPPSSLVIGGQAPDFGTRTGGGLGPENAPAGYGRPPRQPGGMGGGGRIQNLGQLAQAMKLLAGVPDELKTRLLSEWTGIPMTSQRQQALNQALTVAKQREEAMKPIREKALALRREALRNTVSTQHQRLIDTEDSRLGQLQKVIGSPQFVALPEPTQQMFQKSYLARLKMRNTMAKAFGLPELEDTTSQPAANPSGNRTAGQAGQSSQSGQPDPLAQLKAQIESQGGKLIQ